MFKRIRGSTLAVALALSPFAAVLSVEDMKAISAFYSTPAGQSLIRAQP